MFWIVDLVVIAILAICIIGGYSRGLTKSLIKILSFVLALAVALVLFKPVSDFVITNTKVDEKIEESIVKIFESEEKSDTENTNKETSITENSNKEDLTTENNENKKSNDKDPKTTVAAPIIDYMNEQVENSTNQIKKDAVNAAAKQIAIIIINIGVVLLLFIIVRIALIFVRAITNLITKLPVIKQCDKMGGAIYGLIQGFVILFIGLAIISFIAPLTGTYTITTLIGESYIGSVLYNNNILLKIIF